MAEKYTEVNFGMMPNSFHTGILQVGLNGEWLFIKQNCNVIIPQKFLDVIDKNQESLESHIKGEVLIQNPYRIIRKKVSKKEYELQISHTSIL